MAFLFCLFLLFRNSANRKNGRLNKTQIQLDFLKQELLNQSRRLSEIENKLSIVSDNESLTNNFEKENPKSVLIEKPLQQNDEIGRYSIAWNSYF